MSTARLAQVALLHQTVMSQMDCQWCNVSPSCDLRRSVNTIVMQDQSIRACKDSTVLKSDLDQVRGQEATQSQVFQAAYGLHCCQTVFGCSRASLYGIGVLPRSCIAILYGQVSYDNAVMTQLERCAMNEERVTTSITRGYTVSCEQKHVTHM